MRRGINKLTYSIGTPKSVGVALRKSNMAEFPFLNKSLQVLHEFLHRTAGIDPGGFEQINLLDWTESLLNVVDALPEILQPKEIL